MTPARVDRPDARATVLVLKIGTTAAVALFAVGFGLRFFSQTGIADTLGTAAVVALLLTPAVALVTTFAELRRFQRSAAVLALVVLLILGAATALALVAGR